MCERSSHELLCTLITEFIKHLKSRQPVLTYGPWYRSTQTVKQAGGRVHSEAISPPAEHGISAVDSRLLETKVNPACDFESH